MANVVFTGAKEIDEVLNGLPDQFTHKILQSAHADSAKKFVYRAHRLAPVGKTGKTADSIGTIKTPFAKSAVIGEVISGPRRGRFGGSKAHLSEFGTLRRVTAGGANRGIMPKKPFLEPAFDQTKEEMIDSIADNIGRRTFLFMKRIIRG